MANSLRTGNMIWQRIYHWWRIFEIQLFPIAICSCRCTRTLSVPTCIDRFGYGPSDFVPAKQRFMNPNNDQSVSSTHFAAAISRSCRLQISIRISCCWFTSWIGHYRWLVSKYIDGKYVHQCPHSFKIRTRISWPWWSKGRGRSKWLLVPVPRPCHGASTDRLRTKQATLLVPFPQCHLGHTKIPRITGNPME